MSSKQFAPKKDMNVLDIYIKAGNEIEKLEGKCMETYGKFEEAFGNDTPSDSGSSDAGVDELMRQIAEKLKKDAAFEKERDDLKKRLERLHPAAYLA